MTNIVAIIATSYIEDLNATRKNTQKKKKKHALIAGYNLLGIENVLKNTSITNFLFHVKLSTQNSRFTFLPTTI